MVTNLSTGCIGYNPMDPLRSDGSTKDKIDSCVKTSLRFYIADLQVIENLLVLGVDDTAEAVT